MGRVRKAIARFCEFMGDHHERKARIIRVESEVMESSGHKSERVSTHRGCGDKHRRKASLWFDRADRIESPEC